MLGVARLAGIMGAKRCADLIPLCHPLPITKVVVDLEVTIPAGYSHPRRGPHDRLRRGSRMGALTAASVAALTVYDMLKAAEKSMRILETQVVLKDGR